MGSVPHKAEAANRAERVIYRLGIPPGAEHVLILAESSHWDLQWLFRSETYYRLRIQPILNQVLAELGRDSRRSFALESVFFLKLFWERNPGKQAQLRSWINQGRILLTGTGMGQPDTTLPETEAILRDYQLGQAWLDRVGINQPVEIAALPDNFGHSPALPSMMNALGFRYTTFWRIDGGFCEGTDFRPESAYPLPGSTAELLLKHFCSVDFTWVGPDGSQLFCHYMPFSYAMGDDLTVGRSFGLTRRWMGVVTGWEDRSRGQIARRIQGYVRQLAPVSRTRYLFCPMGNDFNQPLPGLMGLIDRYNALDYPHTGIYVVDGTLQDYFDLISGDPARFPVIENVELNPFMMGYLSSRPEIKERSRRLAQDLSAVEAALVLDRASLGSSSASQGPELARAWEHAAISNHHDCVAGTSTPGVVYKEQLPRLALGQRLVDDAAREVLAGLPQLEGAAQGGPLPAWSRSGSRVEVRTDQLRVALDENQGGCLVAWEVTGVEGPFLLRPGFDLVLYADSGGLWRMPWEFAGGVFQEIDRASMHPAHVEVREGVNCLEVVILSSLEGIEIQRVARYRAGSPAVEMEVSGVTRQNRCILCSFPVGPKERLVMDVPGGIAIRPPVKIYDPTFWSALSFVHAEDSTGVGAALFFNRNAAVSLNGDELQVVALRNVDREKAGFRTSLMAFPVHGQVTRQSLSMALMPTPPGASGADELLDQSDRFKALWRSPETNRISAYARSLVQLSSLAVRVIGAKRAEDGRGVILHLQAAQVPAEPVCIRLAQFTIQRAWSCTARERDLEELQVGEGEVRIDLRHGITCVRLELAAG